MGITVAVIVECTAEAGPFEGIHPYNSGRDAIAQKALTAYTNLNLLSVVSTANTNLEVFHMQEVALQDRMNAIMRDIKVTSLCTDPVKPANETLFYDEISNRLVAFFGPANIDKRMDNFDPAALANLKLLTHGLEIKANNIRSKYDITVPAFSFDQDLPDVPNPTFTKGLAPDQIPLFNADYADYAKTYHRTWQIAIAGGDWGSGEIQDTYVKMTNCDAEIAKLKKEAAAFNLSLTSAAAKIDASVKTGNALTTPKVWQQLTNGLVELKKVVDAVAGSGNSYAIVATIKTNQATIDAAIAAAVSASTPTNLAKADPETQQAVLIAAQLSPVASAAGRLEAALKMPRVSSLLMQKELLTIQLDAANQKISLQESQQDALHRKFLAELLELQMLAQVRQQRIPLTVNLLGMQALPAAWATKATDALTKQNRKLPDDVVYLPVPLLLDSTAPPQYRQAAIAAILNLSISIRVAQLRQDEADLDIIHIGYLTANADNESALRMWNSLIAIPVNQLAAYYGSGFKPAEVANIIVQGLGLGAIAWRVHP